jgi:Cu+-exporting ATPase
MITHLPMASDSLGKPAIDPVCGMEVDPTNSEYQVDRGDHVVHFCSAGCRAKFVADPEKYEAAGEPADPIRHEAPGNCPICGMTLEPLTITADAPANHELGDIMRRFWIGLAFALPVFVLEMGGHIPWLGSASCDLADDRDLDRIRVIDAGRSVGWLGVF